MIKLLSFKWCKLTYSSNRSIPFSSRVQISFLTYIWKVQVKPSYILEMIKVVSFKWCKLIYSSNNSIQFTSSSSTSIPHNPMLFPQTFSCTFAPSPWINHMIRCNDHDIRNATNNIWRECDGSNHMLWKPKVTIMLTSLEILDSIELVLILSRLEQHMKWTR